jgi:hypothetical protein
MAAPTDLFHIANQFLGWGDPHGGIWFVGIEEASDWSEDSVHKLRESAGKLYVPETEFVWVKKKTRQGGGIREYISKICFALSAKYQTKSWQTFRDENLWAEGSKVFQTNLYPLGKATLEEWPAAYAKLFGFGAADRKFYREAVLRERFPLIRKHREDFSPQATVAFGASAREDFLILFGLRSEDLAPLEKDIYVAEKEKIIFCPFFAFGHMDNAKTQTVVAKLNSWKVKLP